MCTEIAPAFFVHGNSAHCDFFTIGQIFVLWGGFRFFKGSGNFVKDRVT